MNGIDKSFSTNKTSAMDPKTLLSGRIWTRCVGGALLAQSAFLCMCYGMKYPVHEIEFAAELGSK